MSVNLQDHSGRCSLRRYWPFQVQRVLRKIRSSQPEAPLRSSSKLLTTSNVNGHRNQKRSTFGVQRLATLRRSQDIGSRGNRVWVAGLSWRKDRPSAVERQTLNVERQTLSAFANQRIHKKVYPLTCCHP